MQDIPDGKTTRSPTPNLTGLPPSGVTVTSPSSIKQVSLSLYVQGNVLGSQVQIGHSFILSSLMVLSGQGDLTEIANDLSTAQYLSIRFVG